MPTGFTDKIKNKDYSFSQYAMDCSRYFGACVTIRDESKDFEIKKLEPSNYHLNQIEELENEFEKISNMSEKEIKLECLFEHQKAIDYQKEKIKKNNELLENYNSMLEKTKNWCPPTSEHNELKNFMIEQIETSIEWDCDVSYYLKEIKLKTSEEWKKEKIENILEDLEYHKEKNIKEIQMTNERNLWISTLKESL